MQKSFLCKKFNELTLSELYDILRLRQEVFVVEQKCPYLDTDGLDQQALHVYSLKSDNTIESYARILPAGAVYENYCAISRVITIQDSRRSGTGTRLMKFCLEKCRTHFKGQKVKISAQLYLTAFYESLDFKIVGEGYLEDNIPHIAMIF